jgi:hypothetical protein
MGVRDVKGLEEPLIDFSLISVYNPTVDGRMPFEVYWWINILYSDFSMESFWVVR